MPLLSFGDWDEGVTDLGILGAFTLSKDQHSLSGSLPSVSCNGVGSSALSTPRLVEGLLSGDLGRKSGEQSYKSNISVSPC